MGGCAWNAAASSNCRADDVEPTPANRIRTSQKTERSIKASQLQNKERQVDRRSTREGTREFAYSKLSSEAAEEGVEPGGDAGKCLHLRVRKREEDDVKRTGE
ncbi:unnamed protein product [Caenorhabditis auriculariae]|uniref:Uncharacterized protein n=1 Tax=Caenorhabditis auriculariae TaxID=2777116 RepID=A0A8S1HGC8_9PELO|nr:unnamed protein product [Caenorhabditis auriculariae]